MNGGELCSLENSGDADRCGPMGPKGLVELISPR